MNQFNKYKNYTIRFQYEKIMFLAPFYSGKEDVNNNILNFLIIKQVYNEINNINKEGIEIKKDIIMETFQIKLEHDLFNNHIELKKKKVVSNGSVTNITIDSKLRRIINNNNKNDGNKIDNLNKKISNKKFEENKTIVYNYEKLIESVNFLEIINLVIAHPNGFIIIFFSSYVNYYQYDNTNKSLIYSKRFSFPKRKFIDYLTVDENCYKYYIIDDLGYLFLFRILNEEKMEMDLKYIGKVNPHSCIAYLNNNTLFIGSKKSNSQLIKINENLDNNDNNMERIEIIEEYESLAPISNMILLNNTKEENGIEILTVSGIGSNCCVKNIKKVTGSHR